VVAVAALAAALPISIAWVASRTPVAPGETSAAANLLVTALFEAPLLLVLGAAAGWLLVRRSEDLARRPALAGAGAVLALAGMVGAVYLHAIVRARLAEAPGLPPIALIMRLSDFARVAPLVPVAMLLGALVTALAGRRRPGLGFLAGLGWGVLVGLGAGTAVLVVAVPARIVGPVALYAELGLAAVAVWLVARRARSA
jgi:hypothetical protein